MRPGPVEAWRYLKVEDLKLSWGCQWGLMSRTPLAPSAQLLTVPAIPKQHDHSTLILLFNKSNIHGKRISLLLQ
jgi:hypothetical protein